MAYLRIKDRDAANDAVQEAFSNAWVHRESLEQMENPEGWMVKTLKNQVLQQFRTASRMEPLENQGEAIQEEPAEYQAASQSVKRVFCFLDDLPQKQREVFELREVEGLTYEEIAGYLEISVEQVKVNLHRARKRLKEFLLKCKEDER
ncbi:RNA polymerase sigma-70 factor, ECF subfamily [Cyclobacterium xiamenense]|uniref:RNA polymerase sigma-70 factor, ECF subfamily n=1 Tax=Cyclobacterium xiamenense TaxID=1297121 RepID=A0A1H6XQP6_9BACT|nr:RNA polymerase sigma-70 factor, ECF subfamily [Cyclobacterium xiamenense]